MFFYSPWWPYMYIGKGLCAFFIGLNWAILVLAKRDYLAFKIGPYVYESWVHRPMLKCWTLWGGFKTFKCDAGTNAAHRNRGRVVLRLCNRITSKKEEVGTLWLMNSCNLSYSRLDLVLDPCLLGSGNFKES